MALSTGYSVGAKSVCALFAGGGEVGAENELQGLSSIVFWGQLVGFGLVFFWQEAPGIIFTHSFIRR